MHPGTRLWGAQAHGHPQLRPDPGADAADARRLPVRPLRGDHMHIVYAANIDYHLEDGPNHPVDCDESDQLRDPGAADPLHVAQPKAEEQAGARGPPGLGGRPDGHPARPDQTDLRGGRRREVRSTSFCRTFTAFFFEDSAFPWPSAAFLLPSTAFP